MIRSAAATRQEGMAMILVLLVIAALSILGIAGARSAQTALQIAEKSLLAKRALAIAEAGANHAFDLIRGSASTLNDDLSGGGTGGALAALGSVATLDGASYRFRAFGDITGGGYYVRTVDNYDETIGANDPTNDTDGKIWIVSRGRVGGAERRIEALLTVTHSIPSGIFGKLSVTFGGSGGSIDSFDSRLAPYDSSHPGSHGDVASNGNITLQSAIVDHGDATAGGTVSCSSSCSTQVTGTTTNGAPAVTLSPDPYPSCGTYTDGSGISGGTYYGATGKKAGQLVGGSGDNIIFAQGTYCLSSVNISGGGLLTVNGPVVINVTDQSSFGGGGIVNTTHLASNLQILSSYQDPKAGLTINGGSEAYMQVYAPETGVVLGGGTDFWGSIVAQSISSTGGSRVHRDQALGTVNGGSARLSSWHEVRN